VGCVPPAEGSRQSCALDCIVAESGGLEASNSGTGKDRKLVRIQKRKNEAAAANWDHQEDGVLNALKGVLEEVEEVHGRKSNAFCCCVKEAKVELGSENLPTSNQSVTTLPGVLL